MANVVLRLFVIGEYSVQYYDLDEFFSAIRAQARTSLYISRLNRELHLSCVLSAVCPEGTVRT